MWYLLLNGLENKRKKRKKPERSFTTLEAFGTATHGSKEGSEPIPQKSKGFRGDGRAGRF